MPKKNLRLVLILSAGALLAAGIFILPRFLIKPEIVQREFVRRLEEAALTDLKYGAVSLHRFPNLHLEVRDLSFSPKQHNEIKLRAARAKFRLGGFGALWGRSAVSKIILEDGVLDWRFDPSRPVDAIAVTGLNVKLSDVRTGRAMKLELSGNLASPAQTLSVRGFLTLAQFDGWDWHKNAFEGTVKLTELPLASLGDWLDQQLGVEFDRGLFGGTLEVKKLRDQVWWNLEGNAHLKEIAYKYKSDESVTGSAVLSADLTYDIAWDPVSEEIQLHRGSVASSVGNLEMSGGMKMGTREVQNLRATLSEISMESIPHYYLPLKEAIPFNFGFSGQSDMELSVDGTLDHLSLHANWDLTPTLLAYQQYFSKPKDMPMNMILDLLVKDGRIVSGDYSVRLQEATLKGSLTDVNLATGDGQMNLITNKFPVNEWKPLVPLLKDYEVEGDVKWLLNLKGNLRRLKDAERMINASIDRGRLDYGTGPAFENVKLALDYSPLMLAVREFSFQVGASQAVVKGKIMNAEAAPKAELTASSGELEPSVLTGALLGARRAFLKEGARTTLHEVHDALGHFFPEPETVDDVALEIHFEDDQWKIERLDFNAYDGQFGLKGNLDMRGGFLSYWLDVEANRIALARYNSRGGRQQKLIDGNAFLKGHFIGSANSMEDIQNQVEGRGEWIVTNGEFQTFDLIKAAATIQEFSALGAEAAGTTPFDDLHAQFTLRGGVMSTVAATVKARDFSLEAQGDLSLKGILNYRLDAYLSPALTDEYVAPLLDQDKIYGDQQFGPIPMLLAGPVSNPELKVDVTLLPKLMEHVLERRTHKVLRNFLPEEIFRDRDRAGKR